MWISCRCVACIASFFTCKQQQFNDCLPTRSEQLQLIRQRLSHWIEYEHYKKLFTLEIIPLGCRSKESHRSNCVYGWKICSVWMNDMSENDKQIMADEFIDQLKWAMIWTISSYPKTITLHETRCCTHNEFLYLFLYIHIVLFQFIFGCWLSVFPYVCCCFVRALMLALSLYRFYFCTLLSE